MSKAIILFLTKIRTVLKQKVDSILYTSSAARYSGEEES